MTSCKHKGCGSYAFNLDKESIDQGELCDRHYWQSKAERLAAENAELRRLALAHLDALAAEARASTIAENASANFSDPTQEQLVYTKAFFIADAAGKALRKAAEG